MPAEMLADIMNLAVAVVAGRQHILGAGGHDLVELDLAVSPALCGVAALQRATPAAAAVIVDAAGHHIDEVLFADDCLDHEAQIICRLLAPGLAHQIAGVLYRKFDFAFFVPVAVDLQFAFADPAGIQGDDAGELKAVGNIELSQSFQDCIKGVPSLRIDDHRTFERVVDMVDKLLQNVAPAFFVR